MLKNLIPPARGCAWVTGASSGIGREVALRLARAGWTVAITARRMEMLEDFARTPNLKGKLIPFIGDVTDTGGMKELIAHIEVAHGPIELAIFNAGTYKYEGLEHLDMTALKTTFDTNLYGTLNGLVPVLERMKARRTGHIAITSSVAGYSGLPGALAYGASKAALLHLAEGLYIEAAAYNIKVQVICPGFVKTPLTDANRFPMPFIISVEEAGNCIINGLESSKFEITFPWQLSRLLKFLRLLPYWAYFPLVRRVTSKN